MGTQTDNWYVLGPRTTNKQFSGLNQTPHADRPSATARQAVWAESSRQNPPPGRRRTLVTAEHRARGLAARRANRADNKRRVLQAYTRAGSIAIAARAVGVARATVMDWAREDPAFAAQLHAGGDAYETCNDTVESAFFRMAQEEARAALNWLRARRPEVWGPRTSGPTLNLQQSFQQVNVQHLSDSALAEYQAILEKMLALTAREPHAVLEGKK